MADNTSFTPTGLLYTMLLNDGLDPATAARVAQNARQNVMNSQDVANYLNEAWNLTPSNMPLAEREYFATAILTAMRGNDRPWNALVRDMGNTQPWMKSVQIPTVPDPNSEPLAWAQHYMNARYVVARSGDFSGEKASIQSYDLFKRATGLQFFTGGGRASPPSESAVKWAIVGASDGAKEHTGGNQPAAAVYLTDWATNAQRRASNELLQTMQRFSNLIPDLIKLFTGLPMMCSVMSCNASPGSSSATGAMLNVSGAVLPSGSAGSP